MCQILVRMCKIFAQTSVTLGALVLEHTWALYSFLDPVQSRGRCGRSTEYTAHLYAPIGIILFVYLWGTLALQYEATGVISLVNLGKNPRVFTHQIVSPLIWEQMDFVFLLDSVTSVAIYLTMIALASVQKRLQLYIDEQGILFTQSQEFTAQASQQMLALRRKLKPFLLSCFPVTFIIFMLYFYANILLNDVYVLSLPSVIFWLTIFPLFFLYLFFGLVGIIIYLALSLMYLQIRQQLLLKEFANLNGTVKRMRTPAQASRLFTRYLMLNVKLLTICAQCSENSRLSSPLLSIIIPYFIFFQAYFFYIVTFIELPFGQRLVFYFGILDCYLFLFLITRKCALTVKYNRAFEKANGEFGFVFYAKGGFKWAPLYKLLMAEMFATPRRLHPYAFKTFAYYRITSKTYFLILSYISIYFMWVAKQTRKQSANL